MTDTVYEKYLILLLKSEKVTAPSTLNCGTSGGHLNVPQNCYDGSA